MTEKVTKRSLASEDGTTSIAIVTAKARVLPIKAITTPRVELVAALLFVKIITIARLLHVQTEQLALTDFMIVLHWLQKQSTTLKTFVANRVSVIQELLPSTT